MNFSHSSSYFSSHFIALSLPIFCLFLFFKLFSFNQSFVYSLPFVVQFSRASSDFHLFVVTVDAQNANDIFDCRTILLQINAILIFSNSWQRKKKESRKKTKTHPASNAQCGPKTNIIWLDRRISTWNNLRAQAYESASSSGGWSKSRPNDNSRRCRSYVNSIIHFQQLVRFDVKFINKSNHFKFSQDCCWLLKCTCAAVMHGAQTRKNLKITHYPCFIIFFYNKEFSAIVFRACFLSLFWTGKKIQSFSAAFYLVYLALLFIRRSEAKRAKKHGWAAYNKATDSAVALQHI